MEAAGFLADLEEKPARLRELADVVERDDPWGGVLDGVDRLVILGMGSSHYAGAVAAARLRRHGFSAVAEIASSDLLPALSPDTAVVAISASGESEETLAAVDQYSGRCRVIAMTNTAGSTLARAADVSVPMHAGREAGGVACRSYQHTLGLLVALECRLAGVGRESAGRLLRLAADASADLLGRRDDWLPRVRELLDGPNGVYVAAPARRLSSAQQSALMLREGPRIAATACESGDWSHVDVYLTKTLDYRLLFFSGSRWDAGLLRWIDERKSTLVAVGADVPGAAFSLRYRGDDDDDVRLVTEVIATELLAHDLWSSP
ncbi:MAG TPA: SIS domain-containing protein [Nocardioidaceae bacterium]|nr:SIS domain-containing protein [Nocardioidaceae bacterium]